MECFLPGISSRFISTNLHLSISTSTSVSRSILIIYLYISILTIILLYLKIVWLWDLVRAQWAFLLLTWYCLRSRGDIQVAERLVRKFWHGFPCMHGTLTGWLCNTRPSWSCWPGELAVSLGLSQRLLELPYSMGAEFQEQMFQMYIYLKNVLEIQLDTQFWLLHLKFISMLQAFSHFTKSSWQFILIAT